ncbi:VCBS repeat-containing protein [Streptomyces sp. NBC_00233]|uniref:VCBS repeat-containing protein n=1 Tax=Streptomyces sp. NBC_00233 TaxID=2975686 RepID=UPI0022520B50|nr:VCBS repeat-containing protein [Streptomyces sp. NBC_00233]MCX5226710.1 VCBS repeat-containing protein [Streptomyces sp. NBC_00233]
MHFTRARLAAATALVLSAGMLLATPASAERPAPPHAAVEKPTADFTPPPLTRPVPGTARAGASARASAAAATGSRVPAPLSDFDGDGVSDLIYRGWDGNVYTSLAASGGGPFNGNHPEPPKDIIPIGNQDAVGGGPEVLMLSEQGTLTMYADATPTSAAYAWQAKGFQVYNKLFSPGDVNDDNLADLLARDTSGNLYLFYATGNRSAPFSARVTLGAGWNIYDQLVGIGDNNGDGWADLYARDTAGTLWFFAGSGDKRKPFPSRVALGPGWNVYNTIVPVGDDNGDGSGELLARDTKGTFWYYTGKGNGTLSGRTQASTAGGWEGVPQFGGASNNPVAGTKEGVLARDTAGTMFWYGSRTTGLLTKRSQYGDTGGWRGANYTHLSSLDPDGSSDIAQIYNNGLYIDGAYIGAGWNIYSALVGPGDLTGDGKGDLLARDTSGVLYLHRGNGLGTGFAARIRIGAGWNGYDRIVGAGDYTGDGRADILARTSGGDLYLHTGTGSAATPFRARLKVGYGWNAYSKVLAPGDLNADGKADLLGVTSGGDLYSYLNTSPGKFTARAKIGYGFQVYNAMS